MQVEYLYLIKNGDLHKIGITENLDRRMAQLKPDHIQAVLTIDEEDPFTASDLEVMLHRKFKHKRLPQTEYFRLSTLEIIECCEFMKAVSNQSDQPLSDFMGDEKSREIYEQAFSAKKTSV